MILITKVDCPLCKMLKGKLEGLEYKEFDADKLKRGEYGNTKETRCAIVGMVLTNLELPVLLEDGQVKDFSRKYLGDMVCEDGVCHLR